MDLIYTTQMYQKSISVADYLEEYVDIPTFLECCKACKNYNHLWSCPEFDFDVMEYWKSYETLDVIGVRIQFDDSMIHRTYKEEEMTRIIDASVWKEKEKLSQYLMEKEKNVPESISLFAGSCMECGPERCAKKEGLPCRHPEKLRYSIEALGGNVGKTADKLLGLSLEWVEEGKLPTHFVLLGGLLKDKVKKEDGRQSSGE